MNYCVYTDELYHHGINGQKWGVRRFQNADGSLTPEGKARYGRGYKTDDKSARSKNPVLGRKIGANYDQRADRGDKLRSKKIGEVGAAARGVGRAVVSDILATAGTSAASVLSFANPGLGLAAGAAIVAASTGYKMSNIIRTYQDVTDISTSKDREYRNKKAGK